VKFSQCRLFGAIAFVSGLSFLPGFAFGQPGNDRPAIDLVQDIASISMTIEKSSPKLMMASSTESTATFSAIDLVQNIAKTPVAAPSAIDLVQNIAKTPVAAPSAIDLVQNIAKTPVAVPEVILKSEEARNKAQEAAEAETKKISEVAQNTPNAEIVIRKEFPKENLSDSAEDLEMPEFDLSDEPFSEEHPEYPPIEDPYEGYNRFMQGVNDGIYDYMVEPVAIAYKDLFPEFFRLGIKNVFANAASPVSFVSSLLQGDLDKATRVIGRLVLNSTVGIGGLFDVAGDYYEVEPVNEDMEQVLGSYDVSSGPYLVLPFFGPSSPRNLVGKVFDSLLNPAFWFSPSFVVGAGITAEERVNSTSFIVDDYKELKENAVDPYISLRDFNHQYREKLIRE
jgi:phospholipid-binding lipoprotein MlaA